MQGNFAYVTHTTSGDSSIYSIDPGSCSGNTCTQRRAYIPNQHPHRSRCNLSPHIPRQISLCGKFRRRHHIRLQHRRRHEAPYRSAGFARPHRNESYIYRRTLTHIGRHRYELLPRQKKPDQTGLFAPKPHPKIRDPSLLKDQRPSHAEFVT